MPFLKEAEGSSGGWGDRMVLINQLHKEHAISDGNVEELCFDDPDQVMKYKRKQAVLSFQGAKKDGRDKFDQVFKALELKEVSKVLLPMNGKEEKKDHTETAEKPPLKPTKHQYNTRKQTKMAKDTSKPIEIIIPLAHDRVKSSAVHTDKALQVEYAARYLEKLGVSPSPVNLQLITKHVPLSACKIQQIFHPGLSNHDKKNYIVIRPNQKHAKVNISSLYDPTTIPFEELPKDLLDKDDTSKDGKTGKDKKESQLRSFEEYRESYLFPYNLRGRHSTACMKDIPHNTMLPATGSINSNTIENRALSSTVLSTTVPGKPYAHPVVADDQRVAITEQQLKLQDSLVGLIKRRAELSEDELNKLREEVELKAAEGELSALEYHPDLDNDSPARDLQTKNTPVKDISTPVMTKERERGLDKELANPPSASTGHIRNLLQSFVEDFPFKTHWGNEGMKERLMHNLEGPVVVSFVQKFISFLYWSFLAPHVEAVAMKREAQNYDENFVEVYQDMLEITVLKRNKQHFSVDLPVTILALRVVTETIFKIAYPLWSTLSRGEQLLYEVNLLITQLLDPMNYFSHISAIESSPQALKTLHKKKVPPRMGLSFTSPMTRFIIGDARSREAKALLSSTRKTAQRESAIFSQLTPTVRARLLSILSGYRLEHGPGGPGGSKKHRQKPPLSPMTPPPTSASRSTRPMLKE